jgi:hypothetical protein
MEDTTVQDAHHHDVQRPDAHHHDDPVDPEAGLTTAELLGNAALGVLALVAIWALLQQLGLDIVEWIRGQLIG